MKILKAPNGELFALQYGSENKRYLYKSVDSGASWAHLYDFYQFVQDNLVNNYYSGSELFVASSNHLYSAGKNAEDKTVVFYSTDRGISWHLTNPIPNSSPLIQLMESNAKIYAALNDGNVYKKSTAIEVLNWTNVSSEADPFMHTYFTQVDGSIYHLVTFNYGMTQRLYKTATEGASWEFVGDLPANFLGYKLLKLSDGAILVSGSEGEGMTYQAKIYKSSTGGVTWELLRSFENQRGVSDMIMASNGTMYVSTNATSGYGKVYKSNNNGMAWEEISHPITSSNIRHVTEITGSKFLLSAGEKAWKYECVNLAPLANAGPDQGVETGSLVQLNGSSSSDSDGDGLSFAWEQVSGTIVSLTGASLATPSFTAPATAGTLEFKLTVSDGLLTANDIVKITVAKAPECEEGSTGACLTAAGCTGTKTCSAGAWGACTVTEICVPGGSTACVPTVNGVSCSAITGTKTCNTCGTAYKECVYSGAVKCCPGQTEDCLSEGCAGSKLCNEVGDWGACIKEDPTCRAVKEPGKEGLPAPDEEPKGECKSDNNCASSEICEKTKCVPLACSGNEKIADHKCIKVETIPAGTVMGFKSSLNSIASSIDSGELEKAVVLVKELKDSLKYSPDYAKLEPSLDKLLGQIVSNDLDKAKETLQELKDIEPGAVSGTAQLFDNPLLVIAAVIVILGAVGSVVYWEMKAKGTKRK